MIEYKALIFDDIIDPRVWRNLPTQAIVENGKVQIGSMTFEFIAGEAYPDGCAVEVHGGRRFTCISLEDKQREAIKQQEAYEARCAAEAIKQQAREEANRVFNNSLNVSVRWQPGIKINLSGLSANSHGNGSKRNSVHHIFLLEDLTAGKLKRTTGDSLCTQGIESGHHAGRFTNVTESERQHGLGTAPVNCRACLKIAERFK